jgi:hypothetical protein
MEFNYVVDFFSSLNYIKRKYPMIVTYVSKHLNTIDDDAKIKEVEYFRRFLINNPDIKKKVFTNPDFKTGKQSLTLAMDNFLIGTNEQINSFWEKLIALENILFPEGKPEIDSSEQSHTGPTGISGAMALLETSPVFSDVIEQVKLSVANMGDNVDINSIMEMPDFKQMVESIKAGLTSGKYKLKDLTTTVGTIINSVQDELDEETRNTLKTVTDTMHAVERGEQPNMAEIINAVTNLKIKN